MCCQAGLHVIPVAPRKSDTSRRAAPSAARAGRAECMHRSGSGAEAARRVRRCPRCPLPGMGILGIFEADPAAPSACIVVAAASKVLTFFRRCSPSEGEHLRDAVSIFERPGDSGRDRHRLRPARNPDRDRVTPGRSPPEGVAVGAGPRRHDPGRWCSARRVENSAEIRNPWNKTTMHQRRGLSTSISPRSTVWPGSGVNSRPRKRYGAPGIRLRRIMWPSGPVCGRLFGSKSRLIW